MLMRKYTICNMPDKDIFDKQRKALASRIPNIEKVEILTDVDFSQTAEFYLTGNQKVLLHNSYYIGAVYIESDVDLEEFFD